MYAFVSFSFFTLLRVGLVISNRRHIITRKQVKDSFNFSSFLLNKMMEDLTDTVRLEEGKLFVESVGRERDAVIHRKDDHVQMCQK